MCVTAWWSLDSDLELGKAAVIVVLPNIPGFIVGMNHDRVKLVKINETVKLGCLYFVCTDWIDGRSFFTNL